MTKHIYHYNTHAEKRYFLGKEHIDCYDLIALNGNIVSHTTKGVASFLATSAKDFYIDPQTHAFQHPTNHLKKKNPHDKNELIFKPSIERLAKDRLGGIFAEVIKSDKPISTDVFYKSDGELDDEVITLTCQNVIDFQLKTMTNELDDEDKEFLGDFNLQPKFVIAPYFYLTVHNWKEWLKINIACYSKTKELNTELPTYLNIVTSQETIPNYEDITTELKTIEPEGVLLWIDNHKEEELGDTRTKAFIEFLESIKKTTPILYNTHGGYLSTLLCHSETNNLLNGVGHSVNYGESRAVVPIGGGIPLARFYLLSVHSRLRFGDAASIVQPLDWLKSFDIYSRKVCSCSQCSKYYDETNNIEHAFALYGDSNPVTIKRKSGTVRLEYPTKEAKEAASRHYLYNKTKEFDNIKNKDLKELIKDMNKGFTDISKVAGEEMVGHLQTWSSNLARFIK